VLVLVAVFSLCSRLPGALPGKDDLDRIVQPYIDGQWCTGLVVGLIDEHTQRIFSYGAISAQNPNPPDADTVYEIGSISKGFTGLLLAQMAVAGEVSLDDPVQKHLPSSVTMPSDRDVQITLLHLSTHRSGLPRMPANFLPKDAFNPYADYTVPRMYDFLSSCKLRRKPGESFEYSNLGTGLLGHALALRAGKSYEELLVARICRPLGMTSTRITLDEWMRSRLAEGHDADGKPVGNWDFQALAGAGAIRSTAGDMLRFLSAQLGLGQTPLRAAIKTSQIRRADAGAGQDIALGWHISTRTKALWHNGQTGGYHCYAAFIPEKRVGVVVLCNTATGHIDRIGLDAERLLLGEKVDAPRIRRKDLAQTRPSSATTGPSGR
jgi:CubicO group peptidase (beta-lactamase class C family)